MNETTAIQTLPGPDSAAMPPFHQPHHEEDAFEIFKRLHRLLRGRYAIALSLAAILAAAGAVGGWMLTVPKYTSVGMIRIKTNPKFYVYQLDKDTPIQINSFAKSQANLIQDPRVVDRAMGSEEWKMLRRGTEPDDKDEFRGSLRVETRFDEPEWIYVRFTDKDPRAAMIAVGQIIQSYIYIHGDKELIVTPALVGELTTKIKTKEAEIASAQAAIQEILDKAATTDIEGSYKAMLERFQERDAVCSRVELRINQSKLAETNAAANGGVAPAPKDLDAMIDEIARVDEGIRPMLIARTNAQGYLDSLLAQGFGEAHRGVQRARASLSTAKKQITDYAQKYLDQHPDVGAGDSAGVVLKPEALADLQNTYKTLNAEREDYRTRTFDLDKKRREIGEINERIRKLQAQMADIERRHTMLTMESNNTDAANRIQIVSEGDEPHRPSVDTRQKLAIFGFLVGGGLPIAACLLWGLLDRRYRYSDDASSGRLHPTLLGILPYLPENLADPEQAAIAAHCVHQIRTLLQITGAHQDRRVFTITSPTSGDGKTSLTLSLALSFASSGANTCMIDFDMVGGGLTSAMNAKTDKGLLDALDRGELNGHIRATSFKRLSLIPVGRNDAHEISRLSPEVVSRIINQARERFDVVIIDTGPILGSIEAPLVSSASDGVILTIGHGQGRPQADRAMESLMAVGATLLGVVFNRAQPGDFRRAVSSTSVRSMPNQGAQADVRALPAFGPMARTVAAQSTISPEEARPDEH